MIMEILTGSGGILSYLQDILEGILSSSTKKSGGDSVRGDFVLHSLRTSAKFRQNYSFFDFLLQFYIVCKKLTFCFWSEQLLQEIKFRFIHMK